VVDSCEHTNETSGSIIGICRQDEQLLAWFGVFTEVKIHVEVSGVVMSCSVMGRYQRFKVHAASWCSLHWKCDSCSDVQEIPFPWNPKVHYCTHTSPPLELNLNHLHPTHIFVWVFHMRNVPSMNNLPYHQIDRYRLELHLSKHELYRFNQLFLIDIRWWMVMNVKMTCIERNRSWRSWVLCL
jgi:hypothetical protein